LPHRIQPVRRRATTYGYDKAGNRTEAGSTTYTFNALNQLTEASDDTTYSYDGAGRMTGKSNGTEETSYKWNLLDQLVGVEAGAEAVGWGAGSNAWTALVFRSPTTAT
jgi:YD repeat-containing protein